MKVGDRVVFVEQPDILILKRNVVGMTGTITHHSEHGSFFVRMDEQVVEVDAQKPSIHTGKDWFAPGYMLGVGAGRIKLIDSDSPTLIPVEPRQWPACNDS